jgi:hypothetical protein
VAARCRTDACLRLPRRAGQEGLRVSVPRQIAAGLLVQVDHRREPTRHRQQIGGKVCSVPLTCAITRESRLPATRVSIGRASAARQSAPSPAPPGSGQHGAAIEHRQHLHPASARAKAVR